MGRAGGPGAGGELGIAWAEVGGGGGESESRGRGYCCGGPPGAGRPGVGTPGPGGRFAVSVKRSEKLANVPSLTVSATPKLPAAVGVPVIWPVVELMASPAGRPFADHRYGGWPPAAAIN